MLLRNTEKYVDIIEFSPTYGLIRRFEISNGEDAATNGFFCEIFEKLFGLGVSAGGLYVIVEGRAFNSELLTTTCVRFGEKREFVVSKGSSTLCRIKYKPDEPFWNFFAMEDEDVDSLLLIHNILSSSERKQIFIDHN